MMVGIASYDPDKLARQDLGEELSFIGALPTFQQIKSFFEEAKALPWECIPFPTISELIGEVRKVADELNTISSFSSRQVGSPQERQAALLASVVNIWAHCHERLAPFVALLKTGTSTRFLEDAEDQAKTIIDSMAALRREAQADRQSVETVLKTVSDAAKEVGATKEAAIFNGLGRKYFRDSVLWLIAACVIGGFTFRYAGSILTDDATARARPQGQSAHTASNLPAPPTSSVPPTANPTPPSKPADSDAPGLDLRPLLPSLVPRLIHLTLLLTGFVFCLKNFSAMSHNRIINQHRAAALSTFQTFVTGTADAQIKSAILLQASQAIFSHQASGYLKGESDTPQVTPIQEIFKSATRKETG